jgi:hypothetical protein
MTDAKILAAMEQGGIVDNRTNIVAAFNKVTANEGVGFTLAAVCSMIVGESNGRNIWGDDPWNEGEYPLGEALDRAWNLNEQTVTQADYTRYKLRRNAGYQPQGCGPAQLTDESLQEWAERVGGCWEPYYNLLIGFEFLKGLFVRGGSALEGFGAYNGSGPGGTYARDAVARMSAFQNAFDR